MCVLHESKQDAHRHVPEQRTVNVGLVHVIAPAGYLADRVELWGVFLGPDPELVERTQC